MYRSSSRPAPRRRWILPLVAFMAPVWLPLLLAAVGGGRLAVAQEKVPFARLLPGDSLAYIHLPNAMESRAQWWETAVGRMAEDPQFKPLVEQTFAAAEKAFEPIRAQFGLSIAEWLTLPRGEVGFAVIPVDGAGPAAVLLLEAADDDRSIATLLEKGREAATKAGLIEESETVGDVRLTIFRTAAGRAREVLYLRRDGKLVIGTNRDVVKKVLELWAGDGADTLGENQSFLTLERFVGRAENEPAHAVWYVDPINLVRHATHGNTSVQVGLAILPALGLDGVKAVGGSAAFNRGAFDVVGQAYLLLDVPRAGVVELIALRPASTEPEPWVFDRLTSYTTLSWDVERTYHQLRKLIDTFQGEGTFRAKVTEPLNKVNDLDLETDVLPNLTGRISFVVANEEPFTPESRGYLLALEFGSEETAEKLVTHMARRYEKEWMTVGNGGHVYYKHIEPERPPGPDAPAEQPPQPPRHQACFCQIGKYALIADRESMITKAITAARGDEPRLADSLDFKLIAAKVKRYAVENGPGMFSFARPIEDLRFVHALALNELVREQLAKGAEKNVFLQDFQQALADRPLPPFEVFERYFAPGGTVVVDEPTGIRYLSFVLKRN